MKYSLSTVKQVKAAKKFDFQVATEALIESFDRVSASYEALVAAEGRVAEAEKVIEDCKGAMESIKAFGITKVNMALLNEGNGLDKALGLESLDLAAIESLSKETMQSLQKTYTAALEGSVSETFKALVERAKEFFKKIFLWLKDFFTSNAQLIKIVSEQAKAGFGELDAEKTVSAVSKKNFDEGIAALKSATETLNGLKGNPDAAVKLGNDTLGANLVKESKALKELGWTKDTLTAAAKDFLALATKQDISKTWAEIQNQYKSIAAGGNVDDPKRLEALRAGIEGWVAAKKYTYAYGKLVRQLGLTIIAVARATKKAEPAK